MVAKPHTPPSPLCVGQVMAIDVNVQSCIQYAGMHACVQRAAVVVNDGP
jgi:hypothetical protein